MGEVEGAKPPKAAAMAFAIGEELEHLATGRIVRVEAWSGGHLVVAPIQPADWNRAFLPRFQIHHKEANRYWIRRH